MSKTVELQIEKSRNLIKGLHRHLKSGTGIGVTSHEISEMEQKLNALAAANEECDRLRTDLSLKVRHMNAVLNDVKTAYAEKKKHVKSSYPQEQWVAYGVPDKR